MRRSDSLRGLLLAVLAVAVAAGQARRGGAADLEQFREKFIKNFHRIGLNTTPGDATLLRILVTSSGAKRGVEVGSATGYGAINMGCGFEKNGGRLTTIDIDPKMVKICRENVAKMKLEDSVTVVEGDALEVLPKLEGPLDFAFIDAVKKDYYKYFKAIEPKLAPGSVIVADNVIRFADQMQDFLEYVRNNPDYLAVTIRASDLKHDGMEVIYKRR